MAATKSLRSKIGRGLVATAIVPIYAVGVALTPATGNEDSESRAAARFLTGEILGLDLSAVEELVGTAAENIQETEPVTEALPLDLTVLDTLPLDVGGVELPLSDVFQLGAVNQWATAEPGGTSSAAAGAVADGEGLGSGVDAGFPGDLRLNLTELLQGVLPEALAAVELELGAISSEASLTAPAEGSGEFELARSYEIAGGQLRLEVPALADLATQVTDAVSTVGETVEGLAGPEGQGV